MRRLIEHTKFPKQQIEMDEVLNRYGLTREKLAEVADDEMED